MISASCRVGLAHAKSNILLRRTDTHTDTQTDTRTDKQMDRHTHLIGPVSHVQYYLFLPVVVELLLSEQDFSSHSVLSNLTLLC